MDNFDKIFIAGASTVIGIVGAGLGFAAGGFENYEVEDIEQLEKEVAEYPDRLENSKDLQAEYGVKHGENCLLELDRYINGYSKDIVEEQVIVDLLAEPDQPCGEAPGPVREAFREASAVDTELDAIEAFDYTEKSRLIKIGQEERGDGGEPNRLTGVLMGGGGGFITGLFISSLAVISDNRRHW